MYPVRKNFLIVKYVFQLSYIYIFINIFNYNIKITYLKYLIVAIILIIEK